MTRIMFVAIGAVAFTSTAGATECPTIGTVDFDTFDCNEGGNNVCSYNSSNDDWECDLTANGGSGNATITVVKGWAGGGIYSAWGTDSSGTKYCCSVSGVVESSLDGLQITGGAGDDTVALFKQLGASTYPVSHNGGPWQTQVSTLGGQDEIHGSTETDGAYTETLSGGSDADGIWGYAGDDTIEGNGGNDVDLHGGPGADTIHGGAGDDTIWGDAGNDWLHGDGDGDTIHGGTGADRIYGGAGGDTLNGGDGDDYLDGEDGADTLNGGDGDDILSGRNGPDILNGDADNDCLWGDDGADDLSGGGGDDYMDGGDDDDYLDAGSGNDHLTGGASNGDICDCGSGTDNTQWNPFVFYWCETRIDCEGVDWDAACNP